MCRYDDNTFKKQAIDKLDSMLLATLVHNFSCLLLAGCLLVFAQRGAQGKAQSVVKVGLTMSLL